MNFIKRIKQNNQLKKDIAIAKIIDKPLQENIISIIYSVSTNKDISVLVLERSNWIYPWAGKLQFGTMGKKMDDDPLRSALRITKETIAPSVDELTFQKIIKNMSSFENIDYKLNDNFLNINATSFMIEVEDYVLKFCLGLKNNEIKNMYFMGLEQIIEMTKNKENKNNMQPHFADLFWSRKAHLEILQKTK
jgi:hypothetical protein